MRTGERAASDRVLRDGLLVGWCVLWLALGVWVGYEVWSLSEVTHAAQQSGRAVEQAGRSLQSLGKIPLIGEQTQNLGDEVVASGEDIVSSAREARESVSRLSVLLGLAVAVLPTAPVAAFYGWRRRQRKRDISGVRRLLAGADASASDLYLAQRALDKVPYARLLHYTATPVEDFRQGRYGRLADAELARIGLRRSGSGG